MALHIIEHFSFSEGQKVLNEWYRVLKPGGKLILETPDLLATCQRFVNSDEQFRITLYGHLFAYPDLPGQIHKFLFTETQLRCQLGWAGFKNVERVQPMSKYVHNTTVDLFLAVIATKG
jgi:ubiquinone/menaquinone biosynthesis C-methylase UbiE